MGQFSIDVFIKRPAQQVFDFLSEPANLSTWNSSFQSAQWTSSEPPAARATYRVEATILGTRKESLFEIVAWEPPHRYSYRSGQRMFPIEGMETVVTMDAKDGGTQVRMDGQFRLVGALRLTEGPLGRLAAKRDRDNLLAAKRLLEAGEEVAVTSGFQLSIVVDRPVGEVFAVVADLDNDPRWRREWVEATVSEGSIGVGSTTRLVGQFLRWRPEAEYEMNEYEPNRRAAWRTVRGPLPLTFWRQVEPTEGGTRLTIGYDAQLHGPIALVAPLVKGMGRRALAGDLPTLKRLLEAQVL